MCAGPYVQLHFAILNCGVATKNQDPFAYIQRVERLACFIPHINDHFATRLIDKCCFRYRTTNPVFLRGFFLSDMPRNFPQKSKVLEDDLAEPEALR